jgi:hypothetical protein
MNFADLEKTWRSPLNRPDPSALDQMKTEFIADHDRRRRNQKRFLFLVVAALTVITLRFLAFALRPDTVQPGFNPAREWGAVLLLLLPWGGVVFLARQLTRHDRAHGDPAPSLAGSVRALLAENRMSRTRLQAMAWLHAAILLALPVVVYQLRAAGKAGDEILLPAFVVWPLLAASILLGLWWHDRRKLQPRQRELEELLKSYE